MINERLKTAAEKFRRAILDEDFPQATEHLHEYSSALEQMVHALPPGAPQLEQLARESRELLEWARQTALVTRSQAAAQLEDLKCRSAYGRSRRTSRSCLDMQG